MLAVTWLDRSIVRDHFVLFLSSQHGVIMHLNSIPSFASSWPAQLTFHADGAVSKTATPEPWTWMAGARELGTEPSAQVSNTERK